MKIELNTTLKILDLCIGDKTKQVYESKVEPVIGSWSEYYSNIESGSLDPIWFTLNDIDKRFFILDDGGEGFILKNGDIVNVCWRYGRCRVWIEDDDETQLYITKKLGL